MQLKYSPGQEELFAELLTTKYALNISKEQALADLKA
jgi:hypothetical protein